MIYLEDALVIETEKDVEECFKKYNVCSIDQLSEELWYSYGITLVDKTDKTEYIGVEAQNSPLFAEEGLSQSEIESIEKYKSLYRQ